MEGEVDPADCWMRQSVPRHSRFRWRSGNVLVLPRSVHNRNRTHILCRIQLHFGQPSEFQAETIFGMRALYSLLIVLLVPLPSAAQRGSRGEGPGASRACFEQVQESPRTVVKGGGLRGSRKGALCDSGCS